MTVRMLRGALVLGMMWVAAWPSTAAGQYPTPTPVGGVRTDARCNQPSTFTVDQGDEISVSGQSNCADPSEQDITLTLFSDPVVLAVFNANADGSYTSPRATIPATVDPGTHRLVVETNSNTFEQDIIVTRAGAGTTGAGGRLPRTGGWIILLVVWAVGILFGGGFLIAATWRRYREVRLEAQLENDVLAPPALRDTEDDDFRLGSWAPRTGGVALAERPVQTSVALLDDEDEFDLAPIAGGALLTDFEDTNPGLPAEPEPVSYEPPKAEPKPDVEDVIARLQREINAWSDGGPREKSSG